MAKTKSVTLSVHRAIIDDNFPWTLAGLLEHLKSEMKIGEHVVDRGLFQKTAVKFPQFPKTNKAVAATFALYEEGAEKSTVQTVGANEAYSTAPLSAPAEVEFLDREVAILADGNFMIACGLGKRESLLVDAIGKLANRCDIEIHPTTLTFTTTPNHLTVEKIRAVGVKAVRFDVANFLGSLDMPRVGPIGEIFSKMTTDAAMQKEEMIAELSIRHRKFRRPTFDSVPTPKNEFLERTAIKTFRDENVSSYTIVLDDDTEWEEGDLKLNRSVTIAKDGSTFSMPEALQAMLEYLVELQDKGHLR